MNDPVREVDKWLEDNPVCNADDLNKRERELVKAAWQAALSANGGEVVAFGNGDYTVEVGRHARQHTVFIAPASSPTVPDGLAGALKGPLSAPAARTATPLTTMESESDATD